MTALELRRLDPTRNMRRFYRLDVQPDLFGGFLLLKQWGRIGAGGRINAERYEDEAPALDALRQQAERKRRRGYGEILSASDLCTENAIMDQGQAPSSVLIFAHRVRTRRHYLHILFDNLVTRMYTLKTLDVRWCAYGNCSKLSPLGPVGINRTQSLL
jgi:predicted DNA-binding WGR domain protein